MSARFASLLACIALAACVGPLTKEQSDRIHSVAVISLIGDQVTLEQATTASFLFGSAFGGTHEKISIDDFAKIELRVGVVKVAERVPKADKLLRLEVDIGTEVRQVLAGIAEAYAPETLVGRKVVIVANLAPRKLRGMESNGMIVAASPEGGKPVLAGFLEDVPVGARLK